jgi:hypothetical protein
MEEMKRPKWILLSSDLAKEGMQLISLEPFGQLDFRGFLK